MIATYGVRHFGCTCRIASGNWRCRPIEYVSRETPMMPAFVAMIRIVAGEDADVVGQAVLIVSEAQVLDEAGDRVAGELAGQVGRRLAELHRLRAREHRAVRVLTCSAVAGCTGRAESATAGRNA